MLFKNLPINSLLRIIPIRLILDGIAALTYLKKEKGLKHLIAILKAHFSFYFKIPALITKRRTISQKKILSAKMSYSILVKNKIKGIDTFSNL